MTGAATVGQNKARPQPVIWNVPHIENPHFVGRDELLDQIHETLNARQAAALTAIHGLGGVGKTQLAAHYAHRHKGDYQTVWWIKAEEPATLAGDYASLAQAIDLPEKDAREQLVTVAAVRRWLEQNTGWLLIFDNARDVEEVRAYLPQGRSRHTLITSRDPNWRGAASPLEVRTLPREEAAQFLLERTGQKDEAAALALAAELGELPLALEQAGAYIEKTGETIARYAELFRERRRELHREERPPTGYPDTVATTWLLSFRQAEQEAPAAADLLRLCAFLAPDYIPLSMLREGAEHLSTTLAATVTDQLICNKTIAALRHYSLVTKQDDSLSMHRLVQLVTRDQLTEDERRQWVEAAVRVVNQAFPRNNVDPRTWPVCDKLLPHAQAITEEGEALQVAAGATGRLISQIGAYFSGRAQYLEATQKFERALRIYETAFGPDHPHVAVSVNNLGNSLLAIGNPSEARQCFERALRLAEAAFGPDHPKVATIVNSLGNALQAIGNLSEARQCFERALGIDEAAFGPDHPNVAIRVNNLGLLMHDIGNLPEARQCFERALKLFELHSGKDHPNVALIVNNLGSLVKDIGNLSEARQCYERALGIDEAAFGPDHPAVARDVNNLGTALKALGNLSEARQCFERALRICATSLGDDHPSTVAARENLESLD